MKHSLKYVDAVFERMTASLQGSNMSPSHVRYVHVHHMHQQGKVIANLVMNQNNAGNMPSQDQKSGSKGSQARLLPGDLQHACMVLASTPVIDPICTAFNLGQSGFGPRIAAAICSAPQVTSDISGIAMSGQHHQAPACHPIAASISPSGRLGTESQVTLSRDC